VAVRVLVDAITRLGGLTPPRKKGVCDALLAVQIRAVLLVLGRPDGCGQEGHLLERGVRNHTAKQHLMTMQPGEEDFSTTPARARRWSASSP
jgi:hypothetical protein